MASTIQNRVLEAVFGFKEAGSKLGVTPWVPRFMQSVIIVVHIGWKCNFEIMILPVHTMYILLKNNSTRSAQDYVCETVISLGYRLAKRQIVALI